MKRKSYEGMPRGGWTEQAIVRYEELEPADREKVAALIEGGMSPPKAVAKVEAA